MWRSLAFSVPDASLCCGSFVDNLFATGRDPSSAVAIREDAERTLKQHWRLEFGPDSKQVISACGNPDGLSDVGGYAALESMRCLGHHLSSSCSIARDWHETVKKVWGSYFCNAHEGLKRASLKAQMRFLNGSLKSVMGFKWSRWPFQKSYAQRVDRLQRTLIGCIRPVRPFAGESADAYFLRRGRVCGRIASEAGTWSACWARHVVTWDDHVTRNRDTGAWSKGIRDFHDASWLQRRRAELGSAHSWNRTGTRAQRGHPSTRWRDGVAQARLFLR